MIRITAGRSRHVRAPQSPHQRFFRCRSACMDQIHGGGAKVRTGIHEWRRKQSMEAANTWSRTTLQRQSVHAHGISPALQLPRAALVGPTKQANPAYSDVQQSTTCKTRRRCWHHCKASFCRCKLTTNDDATTASAAASALSSMPVVRDPSLTSQVRGPWSWHELDGQPIAHGSVELACESGMSIEYSCQQCQ